MTPEEIEEEKKKKKPSYLAPSILAGVGGLGVIGGLNLAGGGQHALNEFQNASSSWTNKRLNPERSLYEHADLGSKVMNDFKLFGVGPSAKTIIKGVRSTKGLLPSGWEWSAGASDHYDEFQKGPTSAYLQFIKEKVNDGKSGINRSINPLTWLRKNPEGVVQNLRDEATNAYKAIGGTNDFSLASVQDQRKVFHNFNDYLQKNNPSLYKTKLKMDAHIGKNEMPWIRKGYADMAIKPFENIRKGILIGGASLAAAGGIWALVRAYKAKQAKKKEQELLNKGAAIIETPSAVSRGWSDTGGRALSILGLGLPIISPHHVLTSAHKERKKIKQRIEEIEAGAPNGSLKDVVVRPGGGAPIKDLIRAWTRENSSIGDKALGTLGLPGSIIGNINRADHFNPSANSVTVHGASPSILSHELGHAIDFNTVSGSDGNLLRSLYDLSYSIPFVNLWHEARANQTSEKAIKNSPTMSQLDKDVLEAERFQTLPAAYSTYVGSNVAKAFPPAAAAILPAMVGTKLVTQLVGAKMKQKAIERHKKKDLKKKASDLIHLAPRAALDSIRAKGLLSSTLLAGDKDALSLARPGQEGKKWKKFYNTQKDWEHRQGPNVMFSDVPSSVTLLDTHPSKTTDLVQVKVLIDKLMKAQPDTKIYGMELEPYDKTIGKIPDATWEKMPIEEKDKYINLRHRILTTDEFTTLRNTKPETLWQHYKDPGKPMYAPDVPHAAVLTPNGTIAPEFLDFGDKTAGTYYHGSPDGNIKELDTQPSPVIDGEKAVFATPDKDVALSFSKRWRDNDLQHGSVNGQKYMREQYNGAFKKIFDGPGFLYSLEDSGFKTDPRLTKSERISENPTKIQSMEEIKNVLSKLKESGYLMMNHGEVAPWEKEAKLSPHFKLVYYANRSTPQVIRADKGEEARPKKGYGEITGKRDADEKETATILKGRWLRKDEQDNTPKSKDYKQTTMRPWLLKKKEEPATA